MSDRADLEGDNPHYLSFTARYCENCGRLYDASDAISEHVDEPVHRVDILSALGGVRPKVIETVADEVDECRCTGTVVKRWYAVGDVPSVDIDPPDDVYTGRDPVEDSLIGIPGEEKSWQESREVFAVERDPDE